MVEIRTPPPAADADDLIARLAAQGKARQEKAKAEEAARRKQIEEILKELGGMPKDNLAARHTVNLLIERFEQANIVDTVFQLDIAARAKDSSPAVVKALIAKIDWARAGDPQNIAALENTIVRLRARLAKQKVTVDELQGAVRGDPTGTTGPGGPPPN